MSGARGGAITFDGIETPAGGAVASCPLGAFGMHSPLRATPAAVHERAKRIGVRDVFGTAAGRPVGSSA